MKTFKRIIAWAVIVISIIGILICLAGIVGGWVINRRVTNASLILLTGVQTDLTKVEDILVRGSDRLHTANTNLQAVQQIATRLGNNAQNNTPILDAVGQRLNDNLIPTLNSTLDVLQPALTTIQAINDRLEAMNALTGAQLPTVTDQIQTLSGRIQQIDQTVQQLQISVADLRVGVVDKLLGPFLARMTDISNNLTTMEQQLNSYLGQVRGIHARVANFQARLPGIINAITIALSILMLWIILAHVSLILAAIIYLRTGKMVWQLSPKEEQAAKPALEPSA